MYTGKDDVTKYAVILYAMLPQSALLQPENIAISVKVVVLTIQKYLHIAENLKKDS